MKPEEIKELRTRLGLSQQSFAELIGVGIATVNRWEMGRARPLKMALRNMEELAGRTKRQKP